MVLERWRKVIESGDFERFAEVYAPDCFFEANIPTWRLQRQGSRAVIDQFQTWYGEQGAPRIVNWVETPTDSGSIVQLEQLTGSGADERYFRYVNLFTVSDDVVTEHVIYCPGPWDTETKARWATEESLIRP